MRDGGSWVLRTDGRSSFQINPREAAIEPLRDDDDDGWVANADTAAAKLICLRHGTTNRADLVQLHNQIGATKWC
jgi:hypothetical protein